MLFFGFLLTCQFLCFSWFFNWFRLSYSLPPTVVFMTIRYLHSLALYLYWNELRNALLSFPQPGFIWKYEKNRFFLIFHSWRDIRTERHWRKKNYFLVMSLCLNKYMIKFHVFINIIFQKYDLKQKLIFQNFRKSIWHFTWITKWQYRKNFDLLQLVVFDIIRILLAFFIFFNLQWNMMNTKLSSNSYGSHRASVHLVSCPRKYWPGSISS